MDWSEVGISIQAKESGKENNEGNEGQRRALAEQDFFARAQNDFVQICHLGFLCKLMANLFTNVSSSV